MTHIKDYWKSNARKYCDFCKCWIADNKISVSLHDDGKRHKENVAKKISAITKQSGKDHKEKLKIDQEMAKMEKVAMAAYLKDIENNADLTSQIINDKLAEASKTRNTKYLTKSEPPTNQTDNSAGGPSKPKKKSTWQEAKSEEGFIYYWNTETNEAAWDPPDEGFVSLADLVVPKSQKPRPPPNAPKKPKPNKNKHFKKDRSEIKIPAAKPPKPKPEPVFGPLPRNGNPYGSWTPIVNKEVKIVDLQLPEQRQAPIPAVPIIVAPAEKQFKEKQFVSLEEESSESGFKKRKINSNVKRNTRQRLDDD